MMERWIRVRTYYTKEDGVVYMHESIEGAPFVKTATPFPEIPFVKFGDMSELKKEPEVEAESTHKTLQAEGWTPVACTNECLDTKDGDIFIAIAYKKGDEYIQNADFIKHTTLDELVKKHSMEILEESKFNKKYPIKSIDHGTI